MYAFDLNIYANRNGIYNSITKTRLFKYTEKLITEKLKIFRQKIQIFFAFLLKT